MSGGNFPTGLGSFMSGILKSLNLESRVREQRCIILWDEVVGEQVSSAAQPEFIKDGRMFVVTKSPVWANELTFYKQDIIARMNRKVGPGVLKDIIFKAGKVTPKEVKSPTDAKDEIDLEGITLSDRELEQVEAAARAAGGDASDMMRHLLSTALRLEKWKESQGWVPCKVCGVPQHTESGVCPVCQLERQE